MWHSNISKIIKHYNDKFPDIDPMERCLMAAETHEQITTQGGLIKTLKQF